MNFAGWVQLRRGILDHLREGKLSTNEWLVLVVLIMLADKRTGAGTINAPAVRYFIPELSIDAAKRVLHSLEEKGYIYRRITPFSKIVYPFWVNRYIPSVGMHKGLQIDLAKVFESKDVSDIAYVKPAPDDAPEGAPEGAPDPAHNYKTREERQEKRNKTSISKSESAPVGASGCASPDEAKPSGVMCQAKHNIQGPSALPSALPSNDIIRNASAVSCSSPLGTPESVQTKAQKPDFATVLRMGREDRTLAFAAGLRWGGEGVFEDIERPHCPEISHDEAYRRLWPHLSNSHTESNA